MKKKTVIPLIILLLLCIMQSVSAADDIDIGVKILEEVSQSVAEVCWNDWCGTGFFINDRNIVTNHHIVTEADFTDSSWTKTSIGERVTVYYSRANNDYVNGRVVQDWPEVDLAVLEINPQDSKRTPIMLAREETIKTGMKVYVVGFPGVLTTDLETANDPAISEGNLSKQINSKIQTNTSWYRRLCYTSQTNGGNSGGPVVDRNSHVIGIHNSSIKSDTEMAFFGIHVQELIDRLNKAGISYTLAPAEQPAEPTPTSAPAEPTPTPTPEPDNKISGWTLAVIIAALAALIAGTVIFIVKKKQSENTASDTIPERMDRPFYQEQPVRFNEAPVMRQEPPVMRYEAPLKPVAEILPTEPMQKQDIDPSASIVGVTGQYMGVKVPLSMQKDLVIGRDPESCNLVLDAGTSLVSRKHCCIHYSRSHQRYVVRDLNSVNGTLIVRGSSEKQVPSQSAIGLKNGDLIYVPNSDNAFRVNL